MRVVCPTCTAAYEVPDAAFGNAPKRLRCARCQQEWLADPPPPPTEFRPPTAAPDLPGPLERMADVGVGGPVGPGTAMQPHAAQASGPGATTPSVEEPVARGETLVALPDRPASRGPRSAAIGGRLATGSRAGRATAIVVLAWVLSGAVLATCSAAAVIWRADVMRAWPPSERAYGALGLK